MGARGATGAAIALIALGACALLADTSDLTSSTKSATDATTPSNADANDDSTLADQIVGVPDGGTAACDGATFCDDFDEGPLGARWSQVDLFGDAALEVATSNRSPPNSMRVRIFPDDAGPFRGAILDRSLGNGARLTCAFDLLVEEHITGGTNRHADLFTIETAGVDVLEYKFFVSMRGDPVIAFREDIFYSDGGAAAPKPSTIRTVPPLLDGTWTRIRIDFDFAHASVWFGPTLVVDNAPFGGFTPTALSISLRLTSDDREGSHVRYDNVECTVGP